MRENPMTEDAKKLIVVEYDPSWNMQFVAKFIHENDIDAEKPEAGHFVTSFDKYGFASPTGDHHLIIAYWSDKNIIAGVTGYLKDGTEAVHVFMATHLTQRRKGVATILEERRRDMWVRQGITMATTMVKLTNTASMERMRASGWGAPIKSEQFATFHIQYNNETRRWE